MTYITDEDVLEYFKSQLQDLIDSFSVEEPPTVCTDLRELDVNEAYNLGQYSVIVKLQELLNGKS